MEYSSWIMIPAWAIEEKALKPEDKLVVGAIIGLSSDCGYCTADNEYIAHWLGTDEGKISTSIKKLKRLGIAIVETPKEEPRRIQIESPQVLASFLKGVA